MDQSEKPLKICIDARLPDATVGGGARVVIGLAKALSELKDGPEEYHFYTYSNANEWIEPYLTGPCRLMPGPEFPLRPGKRNLIKESLAKVAWLRKSWHRLHLPLLRRSFRLPHSDGDIERQRFDVIHFTQQQAFLTAIPSIYQPHDLQHLHLPECFTQKERFLRSVIYPTFCNQAVMVVAMSKWGKHDLINHFQLPDEKVQIVPWGPLTNTSSPTGDDLMRVRKRLGLPDAFLLFPAQTWVHKNHISLLEALKLLQKEHGLQIPLICSGQKNHFFPQIEKRIRDLQLSNQIKFVGFVTELELQCLYQLARALVFPSKFEGWGLPITEAFSAGLPVACSNVTCLPAQTGDAALIFNPTDVRQIADQILKIWTDKALRQRLIHRGKKRAAQFSWDRTARLFRAHYRRIAKRTTTKQDDALISASPLV